MVFVYLKEQLPKGNKKVICWLVENLGCTFTGAWLPETWL